MQSQKVKVTSLTSGKPLSTASWLLFNMQDATSAPVSSSTSTCKQNLIRNTKKLLQRVATPLVFNSPGGGVLLGRSLWNFQRMSTDGQGTQCRRNIAENLNHLTRAHERHQRQTDERAIAYSERELMFTFAKMRRIKQ